MKYVNGLRTFILEETKTNKYIPTGSHKRLRIGGKIPQLELHLRQALELGTYHRGRVVVQQVRCHWVVQMRPSRVHTVKWHLTTLSHHRLLAECQFGHFPVRLAGDNYRALEGQTL